MLRPSTISGLGGLRRQIEAALMPDEVIVQLRLDAPERERNSRRSQAQAGRERAWPR